MPNILERISRNMNNLSPQEKKAAKFIAENYQEVAFLKSTDMANRIGVSYSTIIRVSNSLGYNGFVEMYKALLGLMQNKITTIDRLYDVSSLSNVDNGIDENNSELLKVATKIFKKEAEANSKLASEIDVDKFTKIVEILSKSERTFIVGSQAAESIAMHARYIFGKLLPNVIPITKSINEVSGYTNSLTSNDVALVYCLPRYPNSTINLLKTFKRNNVTTIVITHKSVFSHIDLADTLVFIPYEHYKFIDGISAVINYTTALALELYESDQNRALKYINHFEQFVADNEIYAKD